jgi:TatD DNase family protein
MWIDIHAHLYDFSAAELAENLERAARAGVGIIVNAATSVATAHIVVSQVQQSPRLYGTIGISPFDGENLSGDWKQDLSALVTQDKIIGIGEIGLDHSNPRYPSLDKQLPVFERCLELAAARDLPVILHSRGAEQTVLDCCRDHGITKAVFHCYTGPEQVLRQLLDNGYYVSFSGIVTFNNNPLHGLVQMTPLEQLFIETDTPYLAPHPKRGKTNEPANVALIGAYIAGKKNLTPDNLSDAVTRNFSTLFNISVSD